MPPVDLLFVYGALLARIDHPVGRRLREEADLVGPATIRGRLYRVSWYPGLVDGAEDDNDVVGGELYRLRDPVSALEWLDEFEGVSRGAGSATGPDEYERVVRPVVAGAEASAWVYMYRGSVRGLERQPGGVWRG